MINICLATDENYLKYMATAMLSVLLSADKEDSFHFYILCNNVSEASKKYVQDLNRFKSFEITFLDLAIDDFEDFPAGGSHITNTTYYRYKIAELCPDVDKMIYLDCDTIVCSSLREMFQTDLNDFYIGAVEDVGYIHWRNFNPNFTIKGFYINAGVLLMNLKKWREDDLFHRLMQYTVDHADELQIGDQDVINQVCKDKILPLDYKYNVQDSFYRWNVEVSSNPNAEKIKASSLLPVIIHYTYKIKPWNNFDMPQADKWCMTYLTMTEDETNDVLRRDIKKNEFKKKIDFLFSLKKTPDKKHKVITIFGLKFKLKRKKHAKK